MYHHNVADSTSTSNTTSQATPLRHRRSVRYVSVLLAGLVPTLGACSGELGPGASPAETVCTSAQSALTHFQTEGVSQQVQEDVTTLLDAAQQLPGEDAVLLYWVSYVGDAWRGSAPEMTLGYMLEDLVAAC
jgi:hypothetical protein